MAACTQQPFRLMLSTDLAVLRYRSGL